jgi:hypothetical protein
VEMLMLADRVFTLHAHAGALRPPWP